MSSGVSMARNDCMRIVSCDTAEALRQDMRCGKRRMGATVEHTQRAPTDKGVDLLHREPPEIAAIAHSSGQQEASPAD